MNDSVRNFTTRTTAALVALALVLSVVGPVGTAAAAQGLVVTQSPSSATVAPGETVEVTTTVNVDALDTVGAGLAVDLPDGWSITESTSTGIAQQQRNEWIWFDPSNVTGDQTTTYTVAVPEDADSGEYDITATGLVTKNGQEMETVETTTLTVERPETNAPPSADAGDDLTAAEGETVTLDASGSTDPDGDDLSYDWSVVDDAGTGVTLSDGAAAAPTFTAPDVSAETTLTFEVSVSDGVASDTDTVTVTVTPVNAAPTVSLDGPSSAQAGDSVEFTAAASDDGSVESYDWTFGDGDGADDAGSSVTHAFDSAGEYTVGVTVTDDEGATATATQTVSVSAAPPENEAPSASFTVSPDAPEAGQSVSFDASASSDADGSVASYAWNFGDGDSATGATPAHTFDSAGEYTVELTVTDDDGGTATATRTVSVSAALTPADFQVSGLTVPSSVAQGDTVAVSATVENAGDTEATETVTLGVDGIQVDSRSLTLAGGASETVTFDYDTASLAAGDHDVTVATDDDSESAQFTTTVDDDPTEHTLRVVGSGEYSSYEFSAAGEVAAAGSTLESGDSIVGSTASGGVTGTWSDAYTFTGSLERLSVNGDATVYVDGESVDPADYGGDRHTLRVVGSGEYSSYEFSAAGEVAAAGSTLEVRRLDRRVDRERRSHRHVERRVHVHRQPRTALGERRRDGVRRRRTRRPRRLR
ncbi:PKD domain-containing protein [Candidatus Halobonum tyrrellensis]|uniref:Glycoside hydrolase family protein n=1 Tax=Candidatus Halobonum tyrrellensis G22 TaxID=1324957 RepID=V4IUL7_9EURY|nr:PKD domain-containing protein [Candidatus Halobonum tyrrellensis]ESP86882.1 glycoside hydrolase family protein [Candidatus Halobonum tyrrellensis G22]